ncbi:MAG: acyltransferase family protein [Lachnospiraceae bacterium]|nr:acyltransferase family protein [Lachnospiraceae bacterium]
MYVNGNESSELGIINIIKAIGILLVIFGHAIQYASGEQVLSSGLFFEDFLFKFIYSFHMPLFMLVSGYLFYNTVEKYQGKQLLLNRWHRLAQPILVWAFFPFMELVLKRDKITILNVIKSLIRAVILNPWFLWAILLSSMAVVVVNKFFKDNKLIYFLGFLLIFVIPDQYNLHLYKYMYPYFVLGYLFNKNIRWQNTFSLRIRSGRIYGVLLTIFYFILLSVYSRDAYIYVSGITLLGKNYEYQLLIDLYRFLIGFVGSLWIIWISTKVANQIPKKVMIAVDYLGKYSMGFYLISGVIFSYIVSPLTREIEGINYLFVTGISIIVTLSCVMLIEIIKKNHLSNKLFLGGR